jgi:hypothetical protein
MAKQTMGTPALALPHRLDNKLYRIQTPQSPIARTRIYTEYQNDEYPAGTNAVVAVLAYTGFDMEDAMMINKSSMERGFGHASVYKVELVDLTKEKGGRWVFGRGLKGYKVRSIALWVVFRWRAAERRQPTGRERMDSSTQETLQDPILLRPWLCFLPEALTTPLHAVHNYAPSSSAALTPRPRVPHVTGIAFHVSSSTQPRHHALTPLF